MDNKPVDLFTVAHFGIGMLWGYWGKALWLLIVVAIIWELIENSQRPEHLIPFFPAECNENAVIDIGVAIGGWFVGKAGK